MFKKFSMTGSGMLTIGLGMFLSWLGVNSDTSMIAGWVDSILNLAGLFMLVVGQLTRKDLKFGLKRVR